MEPLLTHAARLTCDHKTGIVITIPLSFVTISGSAVQIKGDPSLKPIVGCTNIGSTIKPCLFTVNEEAGHSAFITVGGKPVCLQSLRGKTEGTPPATVNYKVLTIAQSFVKGT